VEALKHQSKNEWLEEHILSYERLDALITESMLYAERQVSKRYTKRYEWSPTLIKAVTLKGTGASCFDVHRVGLCPMTYYNELGFVLLSHLQSTIITYPKLLAALLRLGNLGNPCKKIITLYGRTTWKNWQLP
jgi:hypothetical protein